MMALARIATRIREDLDVATNDLLNKESEARARTDQRAWARLHRAAVPISAVRGSPGQQQHGRGNAAAPGETQPYEFDEAWGL